MSGCTFILPQNRILGEVEGALQEEKNPAGQNKMVHFFRRRVCTIEGTVRVPLFGAKHKSERRGSLNPKSSKMSHSCSAILFFFVHLGHSIFVHLGHRKKSGKVHLFQRVICAIEGTVRVPLFGAKHKSGRRGSLNPQTVENVTFLFCILFSCRPRP